jgi:hypothetical protein
MSDLHLQHLGEVNRTFADQIKAADQKAAYIFTFLLALLFWAEEARNAFSLSYLASLPPLRMAMSAGLAASVAVAVVSAILAILPRSRPGRSIFYWGAWPEAGARLDAARSEEDEEFLYAEYRRNTETLASICRAKYRMVGIALRAILVAVALFMLLLVTGSGPG